ncbi:TPA_asm: hypothetical protein [Stevia rebaudiana amalgavirus 1]|nr:TPA_asm: hypothetical protein [Stevia rebaudiana amalgavirus 1]
MAGQGTPEYTMQKTPAEEQTELLEAAQPLIAFHFPQGIFNRNEAVNFGLPHKSFLKHVKTVARFAENDQLTEVVQLGAKHNIFATHVVCTLKQFISLSRFLTSKEGTEAMIGVNKQAKLQKRAAGVFEASDVALENILQIQRQDYSNSIKTEMLEYDKAIDELRLEMRRLEERKETRRKEIIDAFTPVSVQPEILEEEMNSLAWDMYVNAAEAKGQRPVGRTVGGQELAIANFSGTVKRIKDVEFVKEGDNQNLLFNYAKAKLLSFRANLNKKGERQIKNLVAAAGGGEIDAAALATTQGLVLYHPRGLSPPPQPKVRESTTQPTRKRGRPPTTRTTGGKSQTGPSRGHDAGQGGDGGNEDVEDTSSSVLRSADPPQHSDRQE